MVHTVTDAIEQLSGALESLSHTSAAAMSCMHSRVMPVLRSLAPSCLEGNTLPNGVRSEDREALARTTSRIITWISRALRQQQSPGAEQVQQACQMLCGVADVLCAAFDMMPRALSYMGRSRAQEVKAAGFIELECAGELLTTLQGQHGRHQPAAPLAPQWHQVQPATGTKLTRMSAPGMHHRLLSHCSTAGASCSSSQNVCCTEDTVKALAVAAKLLHVHVFVRASEVPQQLLLDAVYSSEHVARMLSSFWMALYPGPVSDGPDLHPSALYAV